MPRRRPERSYPKGLRRKSEVLDAAIDVFGQVGYHRASLAEIARRAGVTQAGVLHHFASKQELLLAALAHREQVVAGMAYGTTQWPEDVDDAVGLPELLDIFVRYAMYQAEHPWTTRLLVSIGAESIDPDHPAHGYFQRRYRLFHRISEQAVVNSRRRGEVRPDVDAATLAALIVAVFDGLQAHGLTTSDPVDPYAPLTLLRTIMETALLPPQRWPGSSAVLPAPARPGDDTVAPADIPDQSGSSTR